MAEPLRHRQTKEAATDMFSLQPPRHIPTLPKPEPPVSARISASASYGHACWIGLGRLVPEPEIPWVSRCTAKKVADPPDRDTPFWVGCGSFLWGIHAVQSFRAARVRHAARRCSGRLAARGTGAAKGEA